ncbi:DNA integrity scanning diadenylate cyclase DisA [Cumulibacter manganitolerans]|uniref:DNA integrity scanning diadenylate cyclase DisA n=1 Tax=Cumulibacter manganitolerans TaxID=1884992 RepID=UPI00129727EB|nr:DNA integrity scanning diadenylate cyclase DisA [Cumulibacter manganitolerans]
MLRSILATMAPGTALREGLDRILRGRTGGLIVIGWNRSVEALCTGGFPIDVEFSATGLRELCKMDGAVVLNADGTRIMRAGVHLMPDAAVHTDESGTRHRTAQRVANQTGFPVIAVSQSMNAITLYIRDDRHQLEHPTTLQDRANQALATLEKYKFRLDEVAGTLSALEIEDLVTVRDVVAVSQRLEMVTRISQEIAGYVSELGTDGRLSALQLEELMAGVIDERALIVRDYLSNGRRTRSAESVLEQLEQIPSAELIDLSAISTVLGFSSSPDALDEAVSPRGYRLLARVPRLPAAVIDRLVDHFGSLQRLLAASSDDLIEVEGVGEMRARGIRESLSRLAETTILERHL